MYLWTVIERDWEFGFLLNLYHSQLDRMKFSWQGRNTRWIWRNNNLPLYNMMTPLCKEYPRCARGLKNEKNVFFIYEESEKYNIKYVFVSLT